MASELSTAITILVDDRPLAYNCDVSIKFQEGSAVKPFTYNPQSILDRSLQSEQI